MATQRLTSAPMERAIDVVRLLTGVQCQDAPLARYSIGLRTGLTDEAVRAELDAGAIVRTHVLRPTWHFVAAEDLRWIAGAHVRQGRVRDGGAPPPTGADVDRRPSGRTRSSSPSSPVDDG